MRVLQLKDLLERLDGGAKSTVLDPATSTRVTKYATEVWASCELEGVAPSAVKYCARTGDDLLCHLSAGGQDCYLVVLCPAATGVPTGKATSGDDGSTLYVMADKAICRIKTKTKGAGF